MINAFIKIAGWIARTRPDDPLVLSNLNDFSDLIEVIRQSVGW